MNFTTLFSGKIETASQTISAINCFGEYVSSKFNALANFMSGYGDYASTYFSTSGNTILNKIGCVARDIYDQACEQPDKIFNIVVKNNGDVSDPGDTISVTGQDITESFEQQLSELRCQEQYITYCLSVENCTATEFMTRIRNLCPNIAGAVMEKFSNLIEISGSPVDCLKNFFSLFKPNSIQYVDQTISLVDYNDYVGNVWQAAWQIVVDTATSFFDGVWKGIQDLGGFFTRLLGAIVKLGQWAISRAFHNLTTYYDKASSSVSGIMDLPLFQVYGSGEDWATLLSSLIASNAKGYSWDGYNHQLPYSNNYVLTMLPSLANLIQDDFDGVTYKSVCEVIVPSDPCDVSLRLGQTSSGDIVLSAYVISDYGSWSGYEDKDNNGRIYDSLRRALMFISKSCPLVSTKQNVDDTSIKWHDLTSMFINYSDLETKELAQCLVLGSVSITDNVVSTSIPYRVLIAGMLSYMMLMSKGFVNVNFVDNTNYVLEHYLFSATDNLYSLTELESFMTPLDGVNIDVSIINSDTFRPYAKRNQLPVTIHYQTTQERGKEIVNTILKVVIAVVVVVATIKLIKWTRKRNKDTILAHANVDRLSWDVAANPTVENMSLFSKAWNKARRIDFVNGILGLSTGSGTDTISSALGTITNILGKGTYDSATAVSNSNTIMTDVDSTKSGIIQIKNLIK